MNITCTRQNKTAKNLKYLHFLSKVLNCYKYASWYCHHIKEVADKSFQWFEKCRPMNTAAVLIITPITRAQKWKSKVHNNRVCLKDQAVQRCPPQSLSRQQQDSGTQSTDKMS